MSVEDTVHSLWKALSARDWDGVKASVSDDCIYVDMPVEGLAAAVGSVPVAARMRQARDRLTTTDA